MQIDGNKFKAAREAAGKKRSEVAAIAALTPARIWQVERVDVTVHMNDLVVSAVAEFLGVKPTDLEANYPHDDRREKECKSTL